MKVTEVTNEDGLVLAHLLQFMKSGKWELNEVGAQNLLKTKMFLAELAKGVAAQLSPKPATGESGGSTQMKIKGMGPIGSGPTKSNKKKK